MSIITKARLTAVTESKLGTRNFSDVINEAKRESRSNVTTTIFLSHSHDDLRDGTVGKAIVFLRKLGVKVYIDSNDSTLPPFTTAETASKIKDRIRQNKKFILLATDKAISSKWCNWELGYGDAYKYIDNIALLPVSESSGSYSGSEYLRIYPRIEESDIWEEYYKVVYPNSNEIAITDWLKN